MSLYRNIIKQAWNIAWRNKYLWFFGFFAAILGNGGEYEFFIRVLLGDTAPSVLPGVDAVWQSKLLTSEGIVNAARMLVKDPLSVVVSMVVLIVIFLLVGFVVWLVNVSQIALVNNAVAVISDGEKGFKSGLEIGMRKFWPVLLFNMILRLATSILFLMINWSLILSIHDTQSYTGKLLYAILFALSIPVLMSLSFIFKYSIAYIVVKGQKFVESLKSGWSLFVKNWLISLEMAFILFFINVLAGLVLVLVFLMFVTPFALLLNFVIAIKSMAAFWFIIAVSILVFMGVLGVFAGILASFQISAWTTLFIELSGRGAVSKLVRVFSKQ